MADDFGLAISGPADAAGGVVAYHECVLGYARFERWGEIDAVCGVPHIFTHRVPRALNRVP